METVAETAHTGGEAPDTAARKLAAALGPRAGHVVVTAGSAKAAEALLWRVETEMVSYRCVWLDGDGLGAAHLLRALGAEHGEERALPATMRALLSEARAIGRPLVIVVRQADGAGAAALEQLRLSAEGAESSDALRLILLGGPALLETLREPAGRALASRVTTLISVCDEPAAEPLEATSQLMNQPRRSVSGRRWSRPGRIAAAGLLGSALAGAVVPLVVPHQSPPGIAAQPPVTIAAAPPPPIGESPESDAPIPAPPAPAPAAAPAPPPKAVVHEPSPKAGGRSVQVGAFRDPARATALRDELAQRFDWVMVTRVERDGVVWHRVRVEGLESTRAVSAAIAALRRAGHQPIAVR